MEVFPIRRYVLHSCCALVAFALIAPLNAQAFSMEGDPPIHIDRYPRKVGYRSPVAISGHVQGREAGVEVALQRRYAHHDSWMKIASDVTDDNGSVRFRRSAVRFTGRYRLKSAATTSEAVTIRVRPKLNIRVKRSKVMEGARIALAGRMRPAISGRRAKLVWKVDGRWRKIDTVRVGDGDFRKEVRVGRHGKRPIKVVFFKDAHNTAARAYDLVRVHRKSPATWYGPGFFGNRTACGRRYTRDLLGVAHRTLPCGTMVSALYKGRSVRVPVVDRGPYGHAEWDLTEETAQRLNFSGRRHIGVLVGG